MSDPTQTPEGYMRNAQGHLVPIEMVKPIDQERDRLVRELVAEAVRLNAELTKTKARVFGDVAAFVALSAEQYGVKRGGTKGNVSLHTYDGRFKLQVATAEAITFDERLQAAKALIDECIQSWSKGSNANIKVLVNDAFQVDQQGKINTGRVLGLRRLDIKDEMWLRAMEAISDSMRVASTKPYVRFYLRNDHTGDYEPINLDVASA